MNRDTAAMMGLMIGAGARFGHPRHEPMSSEVHLVNILFPERASILIAEAMDGGDRKGFEKRLRAIREREQAKG